VHKMAKPFLEKCKKLPASRYPVWLMRQAGRYLPEYQTVRAEAGSFLKLCHSPRLAAEVTLQPVRRFNVDAAIVFADILLVAQALGASLSFEEGEGPQLSPVASEADLASLNEDASALEPIYETLALVRNDLPSQTALIGFAGGLWTVACYMIEGHSDQKFLKALDIVKRDENLLKLLIEKLEAITFLYLEKQIQAGAEAIQIFESHAGLLEGDKFHQWIVEPTARLVGALKKKYPEVPLIGFPRGASMADQKAYFEETGVTVLNVDRASAEAALLLKPLGVLQGGLDPQILLQGGPAIEREAERIMRLYGPHHIFNLSHGVLPQTPPAHVEQLVRFVHESGV